ncbi:MAG: hypothetical protein WDN04_22215 [Rhodospirillales bacterium]
MLLAFAPFIVFAVLDRLVNANVGLIAAAVVSIVLLVRDWLAPNRTPKILEIGTAILFCVLALYATLGGAAWSIFGVRLRVDAGLLLIVLLSMAVGRPFTLQYAREQAAADLWNTPQFARTNLIITAVWAVAFAVLVLADLAVLYVPGLPPRVSIWATILALVGAFKFTSWYPDRVRAGAA